MTNEQKKKYLILQRDVNYKINNYPISSDWDTPMNGYLSEYNEIIPFELKWDEIIATLANLIDSDAENNLHLYYPMLIEDNNRCVKIEPINVINRFRNSYYYNKWKWAFLEIYVKQKMHPNKISKLLENQNINELDNNQIDLIFD